MAKRAFRDFDDSPLKEPSNVEGDLTCNEEKNEEPPRKRHKSRHENVSADYGYNRDRFTDNGARHRYHQKYHSNRADYRHTHKEYHNYDKYHRNRNDRHRHTDYENNTHSKTEIDNIIVSNNNNNNNNTNCTNSSKNHSHKEGFETKNIENNKNIGNICKIGNDQINKKRNFRNSTNFDFEQNCLNRNETKTYDFARNSNIRNRNIMNKRNNNDIESERFGNLNINIKPKDRDIEKFGKTSDIAKILQREKQLDIGKATNEYKTYIEIIPKNERHITKYKNTHNPQTPDPTINYSNKIWKAKVINWRKLLYQFSNININNNDNYKNSNSTNNDINSKSTNHKNQLKCEKCGMIFVQLKEWQQHRSDATNCKINKNTMSSNDNQNVSKNICNEMTPTDSKNKNKNKKTNKNVSEWNKNPSPKNMNETRRLSASASVSVSVSASVTVSNSVSGTARKLEKDSNIKGESLNVNVSNIADDRNDVNDVNDSKKSPDKDGCNLLSTLDNLIKNTNDEFDCDYDDDFF